MKKKISFDEELYARIAINDLIIFAIHSIKRKGRECGFEDLVSECFRLFPKTFVFSKYPKWPDSRKLDRPLRDLRRKGLVKGKPKTIFSLTAKGKKKSLEIVKVFRQIKLL